MLPNAASSFPLPPPPPPPNCSSFEEERLGTQLNSEKIGHQLEHNLTHFEQAFVDGKERRQSRGARPADWLRAQLCSALLCSAQLSSTRAMSMLVKISTILYTMHASFHSSAPDSTLLCRSIDINRTEPSCSYRNPVKYKQ